MNRNDIAMLAAALGMLGAGPVFAGGDAQASQGAQAPAGLEAAIQARDARLAEVARLAAEMAELARAQAARAGEQARFEVRLVAADEAAEAERARRAEEAAAREAETEARLKEAERRLEEAAREIAELTSQIVGEVGPMVVEGLSHGLKRAMLGVNVRNLGDADDRAEGVLVVGVTPGWPADEAGIRTGDVLVSVGDTKLDWSGDTSPMAKLMERLGDLEAGAKVQVGYRRDGEEQAAEIATRSWSESFAWQFENEDGNQAYEYRFAPPAPGAPHPAPDVRVFRHRVFERWGDMELVELTPGLGDYFGTDDGVLVVRAPRDETLGLEDGDVILDIGGREPVDPGHVLRILRSYEPGETLSMTIVRQKKRQSLSVEVPEAELHEIAPPAPPAPPAAPAPTAAPAAPAPAPLKT